MRIASFVAFVIVAATSMVVMEGAPQAPGRVTGARIVTTFDCAADLGVGVKSQRRFCDVLVGTKPADSVVITIPAHTGAATLQFDLHNRFSVPVVAVPGALTYARHSAIAAVVRTDGQVISRAAVGREFRVVADLFDQIGGGGRPGGVKAVAPGLAESIRMTIPAGVSTVGIVGVKLRVFTRTGEEIFESPGRPVAIVSNIRTEYRPR